MLLNPSIVRDGKVVFWYIQLTVLTLFKAALLGFQKFVTLSGCINFEGVSSSCRYFDFCLMIKAR